MAKTNAKEQDQDNTRSAKHAFAVVALVMGLGCIAFLEFLLIWGPTDGNTNWSDFAATLLPTVTVIVGMGYVIYITREANLKIRRLQIRTFNEIRESYRKETDAWIKSLQRETEARNQAHRKETKARNQAHRKETDAWINALQRETKARNEALEKHGQKMRNDFQKQLKQVTAKHARPAGDVQDTMTDKN